MSADSSCDVAACCTGPSFLCMFGDYHCVATFEHIPIESRETLNECEHAPNQGLHPDQPQLTIQQHLQHSPRTCSHNVS